MWFLLADFEKLYKPHEPPRNPTLRYQNVKGIPMLWDPSRNEENQSLGFYDMTFSQVYIFVSKIFCTHTTLNSIMSCFHFREKDSLSRAKTQTLLQENMISNSHSTPGRNRSSRKRVSKIDLRRLNVSTFVFFFQFQHILLQRSVLPHSTQTTICQKPTRTSQAQQKTSFKKGPSCSTIWAKYQDGATWKAAQERREKIRKWVLTEPSCSNVVWWEKHVAKDTRSSFTSAPHFLFIFQDHFYHEWGEKIGFSPKLKAERCWPGKDSARCIMKQLILLSNGSPICTDANGDLDKAFEDKLSEKIQNDNKARQKNMRNDALLRGDEINALLLI